MTKLYEGLRPNDLKGMVSNTVSIDEYQSKIDDSAVVIAFIVNDRSGANDLNRFIQKSYVELLDTEVSSAPDQNGSYYVFVELPMNDKTPSVVGDLCDDLFPLTAISSWTVKMRGIDAIENCSPEQVAEAMSDRIADELTECFHDLNVKRDGMNKNSFIIESDISSVTFDLQDYGSYQAVVNRNALTEAAVDMTADAFRACRGLQGVLGTTWSVEKLTEGFVVYNQAEDKMLIIRIR